LPSGPLDDTVSLRVVLGVGRSADDCVARDGGAADYNGCIVARRTLRYLPHTPLTLPIVLRKACEGKACPGQTCVQGQCVDPTIVDPSRCIDDQSCGEQALLPPVPPPPPPGTDGGFDATVTDAAHADAEGGGPTCQTASTGACFDADTRLNCLLCCQVCQPHAYVFYGDVWPCACNAGLCTTADCPSASTCSTIPTVLSGSCTACLLTAADYGACAAGKANCLGTSACKPFLDCTGYCL
jgi:hypothetical protein